MPDATIFSTTGFKYNTISERLNESAFLLKNVTLSLTDKRTDEAIEFHYENGVQDFVSYLNEDKETLTPVLYFEGEDNGFQVEVALQYNDGFSDIFCPLLIMFVPRTVGRMRQDSSLPLPRS